MLLPNFPGVIPGGDNKGIYLPFLLLYFCNLKAPRSLFFTLFSILFVISVFAAKSFSLKYFLILILPLFIFSFLLDCQKRSVEFFDGSFWFILFLSVFSFFISLTGISSINLISEYLFGGAVVNQGVRGTSLVFSEPSHAAPFLIIFLHFCLNYLVGYQKILGVCLFIVLFYGTGSGSLFLYLFVYLLARFRIQAAFGFAAFLLFFSSYTVLASIGEFLPNRIQQIFDTLLTFQSLSLVQFVEDTASIASGRFISLYIWIFGLFSYPFGSGFSIGISDALERAYLLGVDVSVIGAYERFGIERLPIMPRSFVAASLGTMGVVGIAITAAYIYLYIRYFFLKTDKKVYDSGLLVVSFFYLFIIGFPGNPFPWLALYLTFLKPNTRKLFHENSNPNKLLLDPINKSLR